MKKDEPIDLNKSIDTFAKRCVAMKVDSAVEFFIEAHLPLTTVAHTAHIFFEPITRPFLGVDRTAFLRELLSSPESLNELSSRMQYHRNSIAK